MLDTGSEHREDEWGHGEELRQVHEARASVHLPPFGVVACYGAPWWRPWPLVPWWISLRTSSLTQRPRWAPSHVGLIVELTLDDGVKRPYVVESTTLCPDPCLYRKERVSGMQVHTFWDVVERYVPGGWVELYKPATGVWSTIAANNAAGLTDTVEKTYLPRSIQYDTVEAALSGPVWFELLDRLIGIRPPQSRDVMYCGEWDGEILQGYGLMDSTISPSACNPGRLVRRLLKTGRYELETVIQ